MSLTPDLSCLYRCGDTHGRCQCDHNCHRFGDCCIDYSEHCPNMPNVSGNHTYAMFPPEFFVCAKISAYIPTIYVIDTCPDDWLEDFVRDRCELQSTKPLDSTLLPSLHWPVFYKNGHNFRNLFCALCNEQNYMGLDNWDMTEEFGSQETMSTFDLPRRSRRSTENNLTLTCGTEESVNIRKSVVIGKIRRSCVSETTFISTCPYSYQDAEVIAGCLSHPVCLMCHIYDVSSVAELYPKYLNPYCAKCNGEDLDIFYKTCRFGYTQWISATSSIQMIWNVFEDTGVPENPSKSCSDDELLDLYSGMCRPVSCAPGFKLTNGVCELRSSNASFIDSKYCVQEDFKLVTGGNSHSRSVLGPECVFDRLDGFDLDFMEYHERKSLYLSAEAVFVSASYTHSIQKLLNLITEIKSRMKDGQELRNRYISCGIRTIEFIHACRKKEPSGPDCTQSWYRGKITDFRRVGNVTTLGEVYLYNNIYIVPEFTLYIETFSYSDYLQRYGTYQEFLVCGYKTQILSCPLRFTIYPWEYELFKKDNSTVMMYAGKWFHNDKYIVLVDGRAQICVAYDTSFFDYFGTMDTVNFIGTIASLIGLAGTLLTHIVIPELRLRTHGCTICYLTLSLFTAQLLPLLTSSIDTGELLCISLAVISHFAWLASFTWMSFIAVNMTYTFAVQPIDNVALKTSSVSTFRPRRAHLMTWIIPTSIVAITVTVHITKPASLSVEYGGDGVCWITDPTGNLLFFGIPVFCSTLFNLILFLCTTRALCKSIKQSRKLRRKEASKFALLQNVFLYMKVCSHRLHLRYVHRAHIQNRCRSPDIDLRMSTSSNEYIRCQLLLAGVSRFAASEV